MRNPSFRRAQVTGVAIGFLTLHVSVTAQQVVWQPAVPLFPRVAIGPLAPAPDGAGLLFLSEVPAETWVFRDGAWQQPRVAQPSIFAEGITATDRARGRVVLFGGRLVGGGLSDQTWEWDGVSWLRRTVAITPPARTRHSMAYDEARGRIVLFGGRDANLVGLDDTWEYDGTTWQQQNPQHRPPIVIDGSMAFHVPSGRTVLVTAGQTWLWDGTDWSSNVIGTPMSVGPLGTTPSAVLMATRDTLGVSTTWRFDGLQWIQLPLRATPLPSSRSLAWDDQRGAAVMLGTASGGIDPTQVYELSGGRWSAVTASSPAPTLENAAAIAARGSAPLSAPAVFVDGGVWILERHSWRFSPIAHAPAVTRAAVAYVPELDSTVLFGGLNNGVANNDTWEFRSYVWRQVLPRTLPPVYPYPLMADAYMLTFDPVLNAGSTWYWNGIDWTPLNRSVAPVARGGAVVADAHRQQLVFFGGDEGGALSNATWVFAQNTYQWTRRQPAVSPPARRDHGMVYDQLRQRVVVFGGRGVGGLLDDAWEWDGGSWRELQFSRRPVAREGHSMIFDEAERRTLVIGGNDADGRELTDVWDMTSAFAARVDVGPATDCRGSLGGLGVRFTDFTFAGNEALPWIGTVLLVRAINAVGLRPAALMLGASSTQFGGVSLPLNLTPFGAPSCFLAVSPDVILPFATSSIATSLQLPIPADSSLVGRTLFVQALSQDLNANPLGLVTSPRYDLTCGRL